MLINTRNCFNEINKSVHLCILIKKKIKYSSSLSAALSFIRFEYNAKIRNELYTSKIIIINMIYHFKTRHFIYNSSAVFFCKFKNYTWLLNFNKYCTYYNFHETIINIKVLKTTVTAITNWINANIQLFDYWRKQDCPILPNN